MQGATGKQQKDATNQGSSNTFGDKKGKKKQQVDSEDEEEKYI